MSALLVDFVAWVYRTAKNTITEFTERVIYTMGATASGCVSIAVSWF